MSAESSDLFLIDGSSYIYRAFFALPPLTGPNGESTHAVFGFTSMLLKLLREVRPRAVGVIFDAPGETFRDALFEDYKANRPGMPDDLAAQVPLVHEVVAAMRLRSLRIPGVEADDVIATLTDRFAAQGARCVVITADKDLMQLVGPRVRLWDTMRDRWVDEDAVKQRFGVTPSQVVDVMALVGDSIDNVPGVKGIGEKTAAALIREYGTLENLLANLARVEQGSGRGAKRVASLLRDGAASARLSRALVLVRRDVPVDVALDDFRYDGPDRDALRALFQRLGFQSFAKDLAGAAESGPVCLRQGTAEALDDLRLDASRSGRMALATEPLRAEVPAHSSAAVAIIVHAGDGAPLRFPLDGGTPPCVVSALLADTEIEKVAHDLKHELLCLGPGVVVAEPCFDTMIASYLIDPTASHRLEDVSADVLGVRFAEYRADLDSVATGVSSLNKISAELANRLDTLGLSKLFREVEMPLVFVLAGMERRGVRLDVAALAEMSREYQQRLDALMVEIYAVAGGEFNINSPPQLRTVLFEQLGLSKKGVRRGKTGYSTDVDVLTRLAREHPVPAKILEYRALSKLKSTYIDALPAAVNPATGRLHTSFNQTVAVTGRLSSSNPNLQNIPIRGDEGARVRATFVAEPGFVLLSADYSQIELRVLAHLAQDPVLIEAFRSDGDVHAQTAAEMFGVLPGTVTADMRRAAKVVNFGIVYGMGPQRLSHELGVPLVEAERYIERYFRRHAGVRRYLDDTIAAARRSGYVSTLCGRRRAVPDLASRDRAVSQAAERTATNTPIQGSAADIIKMAMVAVDRRLRAEARPAAMILQVHDELLFEVAEEDVEICGTVIRAEMEGVVDLAVPLRIDLGVGRHWGEAHG
jgi:DNA polymerase-1